MTDNGKSERETPTGVGKGDGTSLHLADVGALECKWRRCAGVPCAVQQIASSHSNADRRPRESTYTAFDDRLHGAIRLSGLQQQAVSVVVTATFSQCSACTRQSRRRKTRKRQGRRTCYRTNKTVRSVQLDERPCNPSKK